MSDPTEELLPARPVPAARSDSEEELYDAFRETFLAEVLDPESHAVIRAFGKVLGSMALMDDQRWPYRCIDATAHRLQAGLAELRHLQGFFASWGEEEPTLWKGNKTAKRHDKLCQLSVQIAQTLGQIADKLEKEVGDWKFGAEVRSRRQTGSEAAEPSKPRKKNGDG
ncbi:MAG: hypothetical protein ACJ76N_23095 [Thermoanaerobaculia bacterium]